MYTFALVLSIISSLLLIIYLLDLIFGRNSEPEKDQTITIRGQIVTRTVHTDDSGRIIDHE